MWLDRLYGTSRHMVVCHVANRAGMLRHRYIDKKTENAIITYMYIALSMIFTLQMLSSFTYQI